MHYKQTRLHPLWNLRFEANTQGILLLSVSSSTFLNYETANVPLWCRNIHISHCLLFLLCTLHYGGSFIQILIARMVEDCVSSFSFINQLICEALLGCVRLVTWSKYDFQTLDFSSAVKRNPQRNTKKGGLRE